MIQVWFKYDSREGEILTVALIVPCTKTKSRPAVAAMHFGALPQGECATVVRAWQMATRAQSTTRAGALYSGNGWNFALRAKQVLGAHQLWIVSAGFGLVSEDEFLPAYAATFAPEANRVADQICDQGLPALAHAAWWKAINAARGRTQMPLHATFAHYDRVILALSAPYLAAVRADALLLAEQLGPQKLWLVAMETRALPSPLRECAVFGSSDIENLIGGTRVTLNLRALVWWLEEVVPVAGWDRAAQQKEICRRLCQVEPVAPRRVQSLSDEEVVEWIRAQRARAGDTWPRGGKTGLLQALRASGRSCEQKRFTRLCERVAGGTS